MATHAGTPTAPGRCDPEQRLQKPGLPGWVMALVTLVFIAFAGVYAFSATFSQFATYDDQGTMMVCLRGFLEGHPLYDSVRLMYGPFYFLYQAMLHTLTGLPVTHDVRGILCIVHWLAAAGILALAGGLMTRSTLLGIFIFTQATVHLEHVGREPGHPQELVVLLLALAILVVATGSFQWWRLALLGTIGAALVLTKINVGAFYGVGLLLTMASYSPFLQARRALFWTLLIVISSLPFLLMRERLRQAGGCDYGFVICATVLASGAFAYSLADSRRLCFREWFQTGIPFGVVSALLLLVVLAKGTSLSAMLDSTVKVPAGLPDTRSHPLLIPMGIWGSGAALLAAALALRFRAYWQRFELAIAAVKGSYGLLGSFLFVTEFKIQLGYLLPWLWLALIQVPGDSRGQSRDPLPRAMLCLLAGWQGLQAYPMAGTQVCLATFLPVLVYSICVYDALVAWAAEARVKERLRTLSPITVLVLRGVVVMGLLQLLVVRTLWRWADYTSVPYAELRGAHYLRLPDRQGQDYRALAQYVQKECDTFVCTPLLNSLYLWTDKRPPTWFNVNGGGIPGEENQQALVLAALRQAKHPLIVVRESQMPYLLGAEPAIKGPLVRYIREDCQQIQCVGGYRILAPERPADRPVRVALIPKL